MIFNFDYEFIEKKYVIWIKYKSNGLKHKFLINNPRNILEINAKNVQVIIKEKIYKNIFLFFKHIVYSIPKNITCVYSGIDSDNIGKDFYKFKIKSNSIRELKFMLIPIKNKKRKKIIIFNEYDNNIIYKRRDIGKLFFIIRNIIFFTCSIIFVVLIEFGLLYILGEIFNGNFY